MKSFTVLQNLFTTYVQNTSDNINNLGIQLINDTHKYLLQDFFNNERTVSISTQGGTTYTLTGIPSINATSATLTSAWTGQGKSTIQVTFDNGNIRNVTFVNNSATITWNPGLISACTTTSISIGGQQYYSMPADYSKMLNPTITVGNLQWGNLKPILTRQEWDMMNVFPYYADIPVYYYIFPGGDHGPQLGVWPIPATTGNVINFTYKFRAVDLSLPDYSTGTVTATNGSSLITSSGASFIPTINSQVESRWIQIPQITSAGVTNGGDNQWYQILSATATVITLAQPYAGTTVTSQATGYTLGQMPLINEDFHDLLVYRPLILYFSSIQLDATKAGQFSSLYNDGMARLRSYCNTDVVDINLGRRLPSMNPNLFYFGK